MCVYLLYGYGYIYIEVSIRAFLILQPPRISRDDELWWKIPFMGCNSNRYQQNPCSLRVMRKDLSVKNFFIPIAFKTLGCIDPQTHKYQLLFKETTRHTSLGHYEWIEKMVFVYCKICFGKMVLYSLRYYEQPLFAIKIFDRIILKWKL